MAITGGLASLGDVARASTARAGGPLAATASHSVEAGFLSLLDAAPLMSALALALALTGWWLLKRDTARRGDDELALRQQVRRLHDAMHASADGVFLLRALRNDAGEVTDFVVTDVNPTAARLMRSTHDQLVGRRLQRDFPFAVATPLLEQYADAIALNAPLVEDVRVDPRRFAASWLLHQAVPTADGVAVTIRDISARKREELRLRRASLTDHLTMLYNRRGFLTLAEQHLRIARRQEKDAVLLYVDMDDFKQLNDTHGHAVGDKALAAVGRLLRRTVRDCDVVARMGGDEFTIMALDADGAAARLIQRRIEERIALLNASAELPAPLSLTIGYTRVRPTDDASLSELLSRADQLLYARKRRRKLTVAAEKTRVRRPERPSRSHAAPMHSPTTLLPPDLAAIARAAASVGVAATASAPSYSPTHAA